MQLIQHRKLCAPLVFACLKSVNPPCALFLLSEVKWPKEGHLLLVAWTLKSCIMLYFPHAWNHCSAIGSVSQLSADSLTQRQTHVQDCRQTLLFQHWFVLHCWEEISLKLWPCNIAVLSWGPPMELMVIPVVWQVYLTYHDVTEFWFGHRMCHSKIMYYTWGKSYRQSELRAKQQL